MKRMKLQNQEIIITIGKKNFKYLAILEVDAIKQSEKKKNFKWNKNEKRSSKEDQEKE